MRLRALFVMGLWASMAAGAVEVFDRHLAHGVLTAAAVVGGLMIVRMVVTVRRHWRRLRLWRRPGDVDDYPAGPRRVLLVETGLAGPR